MSAAISPKSIDQDNPVEKALAASRAAAERRLYTAACLLHSAIPEHGVIFERLMERKGCQAVQVLFQWPGMLMLVDPIGGEPMREVCAADMRADVPAAAAFMADKTGGKPLKAVLFQPPQGKRLCASFWADGVVRVNAVDSGELLAESEPGEPCTLRAGFHTLTAQDLAPRID